ncbi:MAG TPA: radical SAM protein [Candidatus Paceibacterota bacterium]
MPTENQLEAKMNIIERDNSLGKTVVPKKVALIAAPWLFFNEVEFRSQQIGLGYIGAYAKQFGHQIVAFIDPMLQNGHLVKQPVQTKLQLTNRFGHSDDWIVSQIPKDVDVIGVNAPFTDSRLAVYPMIDAIKRAFPNVPIVVGGVLATTLSLQVLKECKADIVIRGEGEVAFSRILNGDLLQEIPGLAFRKEDGTIFVHPQRSEQLRTIDDIPQPGYDFRPMQEYVMWSPRGDKADRTLSLISSRGCPFTCEFCSIPEKGQRWRPFTPERVLQEIQMMIEKFGVNHIEFEDDNFTLQEPRALAVLQHLANLRRKGHRFSCSFPNGIMIDKMTSSLAELLVQAGADIVYLPVESGDTRVLMSMDKPVAEHHLAKTLEVSKWCVDAGLRVSCFFIVAYPGGRLNPRHVKSPTVTSEYGKYLIEDGKDVYMRGEDEQSFETTVKFCKKLLALGVHGITPLIATPYPGTEMYEVCEKFGWLAFKDARDVLTTVSYAAVNPGRVQLSTPWCSQQEAFERWQGMMDLFPTFHNVRKAEDKTELLKGEELRRY